MRRIWHRLGWQVAPAELIRIAAVLAELRELSPERIAEQTTLNARAVFPKIDLDQ